VTSAPHTSTGPSALPRPVAIAVVLLLTALSVWWAGRITGAQVESDAANNLRMSLNLAHHGTMSMDAGAPYSPSMYREPLPIVVTALNIWLLDAVAGRADTADYYGGARARALKYQNILWMWVLCIGMFVAVRALTGSNWLAVAGLLAMTIRLPATPTGLESLDFDELMSDLAAAGVLVWASVALMKAIEGARRSAFVWAGVLFGLLALIKAAFLYIFVGVVIGAILLDMLAGAGARPWRSVLPRAGLLAICFAAVVSPWMIRNYVQLGAFSIAERGGVILLMRAEKNRMSWDEYRGAFFVWAPPKLQPLVGRILGYSLSDFERGGRLERLNRYEGTEFHRHELQAELSGKPEDAVTFYHKARAQRVQLQKQFAEHGAPPDTTVDDILQQRALSMIGAHPFRHLAMVLPFLWRGAFTVFPILAVAVVLSLVRRRYAVVGFLLASTGMVMFYALFTHYTGRYSVPAVGVTVAAALFLVHSAWHALRRKATRAPGMTGLATGADSTA
jgi:hypothetical protein